MIKLQVNVRLWELISGLDKCLYMIEFLKRESVFIERIKKDGNANNDALV